MFHNSLQGHVKERPLSSYSPFSGSPNQKWTSTWRREPMGVSRDMKEWTVLSVLYQIALSNWGRKYEWKDTLVLKPLVFWKAPKPELPNAKAFFYTVSSLIFSDSSPTAKTQFFPSLTIFIPPSYLHEDDHITPFHNLEEKMTCVRPVGKWELGGCRANH